jgi:hypothetical protein
MRYMTGMGGISNIPSLPALVNSGLGGGYRVHARFVRTLASTAPAVKPEDFDRCPVLLAGSGIDRITLPAGVDQLGGSVLEFLDALRPGRRRARA